MHFQTPAPDMDLLVLLNQTLRAPLLDCIMPVVSSKITLFSILALCLIWAVRRRGPRQIVLFLVLLAGMGLSDLGVNAVKKSVARVRPLNSVAGTFHHEDGRWLRLAPDFVQVKEKGTSYPSAHAANTMALAVLAMLLWPGTRPFALAAPLVVGWSRLYLGKHFPTDVLAGWMLGLVAALAVWLVWSRLLRPRLLPEQEP
ncbi:MAG: phosphatase PAP2 family protein [Desulfovibrionaceae bacterium]|nr:phosphatase PAP2 family protein [Desulfovibrionaceae bacterium]